VIVQVGPGIEALDLEGRAVEAGERINEVSAIIGLDVLDLEDPVAIAEDGPALEVAGDVFPVVGLPPAVWK
jgi:hypothetical protein